MPKAPTTASAMTTAPPDPLLTPLKLTLWNTVWMTAHGNTAPPIARTTDNAAGQPKSLARRPATRFPTGPEDRHLGSAPAPPIQRGAKQGQPGQAHDTPGPPAVPSPRTGGPSPLGPLLRAPHPPNPKRQESKGTPCSHLVRTGLPHRRSRHLRTPRWWPMFQHPASPPPSRPLSRQGADRTYGSHRHPPTRMRPPARRFGRTSSPPSTLPPHRVATRTHARPPRSPKQTFRLGIHAPDVAAPKQQPAQGNCPSTPPARRHAHHMSHQPQR